MLDRTQEKFVLDQLESKGKISRNICLQNYISRLSAIILNLKKKGYDFRTEREGGDYVYHLVSKPQEEEDVWQPEVLKRRQHEAINPRLF